MSTWSINVKDNKRNNKNQQHRYRTRDPLPHPYLKINELNLIFVANLYTTYRYSPDRHSKKAKWCPQKMLMLHFNFETNIYLPPPIGSRLVLNGANKNFQTHVRTITLYKKPSFRNGSTLIFELKEYKKVRSYNPLFYTMTSLCLQSH